MSENQLVLQKKSGITSYLSSDAVKENISQVIGDKNVTRFISSVVSAVQINPTLAECTNNSILSAALQGEALQLAPSPQLGQFYMVPYDNKKVIDGKWMAVKEAQFQIGYKGYLQLAIRSGQYRKIVVSEIKEGEIEYNPITEDITLHPIMNPAEREKAKTIGYFAMFELNNGFRKEMYSPTEKIDAHARKYSSSYRYDLNNNKKGSKWTTDFDAMAKKTLIRELIGKWGIMSVEMQRAYQNDMAVIDDEGNPKYIDNSDSIVDEIQNGANTEDFVLPDEESNGGAKDKKETAKAAEAKKEASKPHEPEPEAKKDTVREKKQEQEKSVFE